MIDRLNSPASCPALCRASTSSFFLAKTWMAGTSPAMTRRGPHGAPEDRSRLPPPRLRGQDFDAVRWLRSRFDHAVDHRGLLRAFDRAASRRQDFGHRLLLENAGLFPRQFAWLQFGPRPHAIGPDRRQPRQPRSDLSRGLRRWR